VLKTVLVVPHPQYENHNAGDIHFGPDGMLYLSTGDGGAGDDPFSNAQKLSSLSGKILRIDVRRSSPGKIYSIPTSNPFVRVKGARGEVWAYGLRNPWRFSFDSATGQMWIADVGQNLHEEVNVAAKGAKGLNFGWPCREGAFAYQTWRCRSGTKFAGPRLNFPHYEGPTSLRGASVTGGYVYRGAKYASIAAGPYIAADYETANVWLYRPNYPVTRAAKVPYLAAFGQDHRKELWAVDVAAGTLYSIGFKRR
jgi:glucose/arabinose dehydrogenase